jgi:hypothetical protein
MAGYTDILMAIWAAGKAGGYNIFQIMKSPAVKAGVGVAVAGIGIGAGAYLAGAGVKQATTGVKELGTVETPLGKYNIIGIIMVVVGILAVYLIITRKK